MGNRMNISISLSITLCMALAAGLAQGGDVALTPAQQADFVGSCIPSCERTTRNDPTTAEWKMTASEITSTCSCNCKEMAKRVTPALRDSLQDKDKATVQSNADMRRISIEAMNVCYPAFFASRSKSR
jgi:hypothetical protein